MHIITYQPHLIYPDVSPLVFSDYENAIAYFMERFCHGFSGNFALYQFGKIRTPGVSDIDLLIIVEDDQWKPAREKAKAIINSSGSLQYLFVHEPLIICRSLVPHLIWIHTLENCRYLQGTWNPLGEANVQAQPEHDAQLFQHAIWNSIMRVSASALDKAEIGLRHSLVLLNNLLTSANRGNEFLPNPVSISLTSEGIRTSVLSAPFPEQEQLVKVYISQVVEYLNKVDTQIDQELASKLGLDLTRFDLVPLTKKRFIASPLSVLETQPGNHKSWNKLLHGAEVIPAPVYLVFFSAFLAQECQEYFPEYRVLRSTNKFLTTVDSPGFNQYVHNVIAASRIFKNYRMDYSFPRPFSVKRIKMSARDKVVQVARRHFIRQLLSPGFPE
jgi:hypothetical protein